MTKRRKKNLGTGIALACAGIIAVGSVGLASQGFSDWKWLTQESDSNITISQDNIFGCTNNPAEKFSIVQAKNGRIRVSTDGHNQVALTDSEGNPVTLSDLTRISCKVDFDSDGMVGFALPIVGNFHTGRAYVVYLKNEGNKQSVVITYTDHINGEVDGEVYKCIEGVLAFAELPHVSSELDIVFDLIADDNNNRSVNLGMVVNGQMLNWERGEATTEFASFNIIDGRVRFEDSLNSSKPICLDVYNVVANIDNLQVLDYSGSSPSIAS